MGAIRVHVTAFWLSEERSAGAISGLREVEVSLPEASSLKDLIGLLIKEFPGVKASDVMLLLNNRLVRDDAVLRDGDKVGLFPPLIGG